MDFASKRITQIGQLRRLEDNPSAQPYSNEVEHVKPGNGHSYHRKRLRRTDDARNGSGDAGTQDFTLRIDKSSKQTLPLRHESPYDHYKLSFGVDLGGLGILAVKKTPPYTCAIVRRYRAANTKATFSLYQDIRHKNLHNAIEAFLDDDLLYFILEDISTTLEKVITCAIYPDEAQLNAILGQVNVSSPML